MNSIKVISYTLIILTTGCNPGKNSDNKWVVQSETEWFKDEGLQHVESILYDQEEDVFYASNGASYKPGVEGFLSKLSLSNDKLDLKWVSELNRPTGMAMKGSLLYVADVNFLVIVDSHTGEVIKKYPEPIANAGLNDVAISPDGEVYVTASFVHAVFKLQNERLILWKQDTTKLQWANGIIAEDERLIVGGQFLCSIDLETKKITPIHLEPTINDFDGITSDGQEGYFLTTVENSGLYHWSKGTGVRKLSESYGYYGDLTFDAQRNRLLIPRGLPESSTYFITELNVSRRKN